VFRGKSDNMLEDVDKIFPNTDVQFKYYTTHILLAGTVPYCIAEKDVDGEKRLIFKEGHICKEPNLKKTHNFYAIADDHDMVTLNIDSICAGESDSEYYDFKKKHHLVIPI
jgi:hypothetical protein